MPRYSAFQFYSERDTKTVSGYVEKESKAGSSTSGEKSTGGKERVVTERVENVSGSTAGASSSEFHMYLNARARERARLESIESNLALEKESKALQERVEANRREAEERTQKNAAKRKRKKEKALAARKNHKSSVPAAGGEGEEEGDEDGSSATTTAAVGVNEAEEHGDGDDDDGQQQQKRQK